MFAIANENKEELCSLCSRKDKEDKGDLLERSDIMRLTPFSECNERAKGA